MVGGLWIWETTWPLIVRVVLTAGIAGWNLLVFLPRGLQAGTTVARQALPTGGASHSPDTESGDEPDAS